MALLGCAREDKAEKVVRKQMHRRMTLWLTSAARQRSETAERDSVAWKQRHGEVLLCLWANANAGKEGKEGSGLSRIISYR